MIDQIRAKGARLLVPGIIDFYDIIDKTDDTMSKIVLETMTKKLGLDIREL